MITFPGLSCRAPGDSTPCGLSFLLWRIIQQLTQQEWARCMASVPSESDRPRKLIHSLISPNGNLWRSKVSWVRIILLSIVQHSLLKPLRWGSGCFLMPGTLSQSGTMIVSKLRSVIALFFTLILRPFSQPCHPHICSSLTLFPCYLCFPPCFHANNLLFN